MGILRKKPVIIGAIASIVIIVIISAMVSQKDDSIMLTGTLTIGSDGMDTTGIYEGNSCNGLGEYADVGSGSRISAVDTRRKTVLNVATIGSGVVDKYGNCIFRYSLIGLPRVEQYSLVPAAREPHDFSLSQLKKLKYKPAITIGKISNIKLAKRPSESGGSASKNYQLQDISSEQGVK